MANRDSSQEPHRDDEESAFKLDQEIARKYDPSALSRLIVRDAGRGEPLDLHTRTRMESRLGGNFSNVRIIRGPLAEEITARYRADAVTVGGTEFILVREGWQSNFQSAEGHALLAHELTHVRQAQQGLHFEHSGGGDESSPHEREAYQMQASVRAEEQGRHLGEHMTQRQMHTERKIWADIKKKVHKELKKQQNMSQDRNGETNTQSQTR